MDRELEKYLSEHSSPQNGALEWIVRETNLRTNHAQMLSERSMGRFISMMSRIISPLNILEIGVFTGYSTVCLAEGLVRGGVIDAIEINDELEELILQGYEKAGIKECVKLHIGDAKDIIAGLDRKYDLVYIDGNKREYPLYYDLIIDRLNDGGVIIADNVLWYGKVFNDDTHQDAQTQGILRFNEMVRNDPRVENMILPLRDGVNIILKKNAGDCP